MIQRREAMFIAGVFALGAMSLTLSFFFNTTGDWFGLVTVVGLTALSERLAVRLYFDGRVSVSFVGTVLSLLVFGPVGGALAASSIALTVYFTSGRPARKLLFNFGQHNIGAFAAIGCYSLLTAGIDAAAVLLDLAGGAVAGLVIYAVSSACVSSIMSITLKRPLRSSYQENFGWLLPHYVALGLVGGGLAFIYGQIGVAAVLVLTVPLFLSRYSIEQFVNRTRDNVLRLERSNQQIQQAYVEIRDMSEELREAYTGTLESLVTALDARDQETRGHSVRVATHSLDIARMLGIDDDDELAMIYRGALMHDVGKIGVPDAILLKPAKLTDEEWEFMRRHPAIGYRILAQVPYMRPAARIVLAHHERWDGAGYPRRLKGEDIPLGARIFALCDTYDAIISDRPYRAGQSPDAALQEILRCSGSQFDPRIIEAFEAAFPRWREEDPKASSKPLYLPSWRKRDSRSEEQGRAAS